MHKPLLNSKSCHSSAHSHASSPTVDECVGMKVWFILVISIRSVGPWEGSAIKSGLWLGLFNTVSVKWLKVNGTLTQSDRNSSCSWSNCCCIKVGQIHCGNTALNKRCLFTCETTTVGCYTTETQLLEKDVPPMKMSLLWGKRYQFYSRNTVKVVSSAGEKVRVTEMTLSKMLCSKNTE